MTQPDKTELATLAILLALSLATAWGVRRVDAGTAKRRAADMLFPRTEGGWEAAEPLDPPTPPPLHCESWRASWYGPGYHGKVTARGWRTPKGQPHHRERFDQGAMTAAHKSLPFGTMLHVRARNGNSVDVEINDRGPYIRGRHLDLSRAAMAALDGIEAGVIHVEACW